jgi:ketosteroid isomerase-like protein
MTHEAFRAAVEAHNHDAMVEALASDVVFHSPVTFKPFEGREAVAVLLGVVMRTFEDFRYTDEIDADGKIADFTVMVRPVSATMALAEAVGKGLEQATASAA